MFAFETRANLADDCTMSLRQSMGTKLSIQDFLDPLRICPRFQGARCIPFGGACQADMGQL